MTGANSWKACVIASVVLIPSLARAAPSCTDLLALFPQPGRTDPTQTGNAFRPLPTLASVPGGHGIALTMDAVRFGLPTASGIVPPGQNVWIGNYQVRDVPAFAIAARPGTAATLSRTASEGGQAVALPAGCLSDPRLIYGGTHWSLLQGQTIRASLGSRLDYVGPDMVNVPFNGGAPCRSVNLHTHGLLVSPYRPSVPGGGKYGDYVLDVTLAPHSAAGGTDDCQALLGPHVHGVTAKRLEHEVRIPGTPGVSSIAEGQHPSGLFWYHPHTHGYSRGQVGGGTTGVITVGRLSDYACVDQAPAPGASHCPTGNAATHVRLVELKDAQVLPINGGPTPYRLRSDYDAGMCARLPQANEARPGECDAADGGGGKWIFTVNGVQYPTIAEPDPGQDEVWRIANASPNISYRLSFVPQAAGPDGGQRLAFQVIAIDGVSIPQTPGSSSGIYETNEILMMPGTRAEVRVPAPSGGGSFVLRNQVVSTGANDSADVWPQMDLMAVTWPTPPAMAMSRLVARARQPGIAVLGPQLPAAAPQVARALSRPNLPEGCTLNPGDERSIYFVHRTRPMAGNAEQEVFGILAGIRRNGEDRVRFFDSNFKEVPGLNSVADVWRKIIPDPNDINNAAPAFDTSPFGNICAVRGRPTETWVIQNITGEDHNFHLHQSRFTLDTAHLADTTGHWFQFPTGTARDPASQQTDALIEAISAQQTGGNAPSWTTAHHDSVPVPRGEGFCANGLNEQGCTPDQDSNGQPIPRECSGDPTDNSCKRPGIVSINVTFGRSTQVGEFVYHCHILEHEDLGMMARVRVICPDGGTSCGIGAGEHGSGGGHQHH